MNKEELKYYVNQEIDWIRYYGYRNDRESLNLSKGSIYDQIRSIGYTKVNTDLDLRCSGYLSIKYIEGKSIEEMEVFNSRRKPEYNKLTPLEVIIKLYPNEIDIYSKLNRNNN